MEKHCEFKPECFYDLDALRRMLGLTARVLGDACRAGQLRFTDKGGKRFFRGAWVIAWLENEPVSENPKEIAILAFAAELETLAGSDEKMRRTFRHLRKYTLRYGITSFYELAKITPQEFATWKGYSIVYHRFIREFCFTRGYNVAEHGKEKPTKQAPN